MNAVHHHLVPIACALLCACPSFSQQPEGGAAPDAADPPVLRTAPALVAEAGRQAARLRDPAPRCLAQADVALAWHQLGDARAEKHWAAALLALEAVKDPVQRPLAARGLAMRWWPVAPGRARALFEEAVAAAQALPYVAQRALVLREIGRALGALDPALAQTVLSQALTAAREVEAPVFEAAALRDIATVLTLHDPAAADQVFSEAAGLLPPASPDEPLQLARIELAAVWAPSNIAAATAEADLIGDPRLREVCYRRMCEALAPVNPDLALQIVAKIQDPVQRALALAALAAELAGTQPETAAGMALATVPEAEKMEPLDRMRLCADVAVALAPQDMPQALGMLARVEDEQAATDAVKRIIVRLAQADTREALRILERIEDWGLREAAVAEIMPRIAALDVAEAVAAANELLAPRARVQALLQIAAVVAAPEPPQKATP